MKKSGKQGDRRRIGLLGGSFNPAHDGHREISILALERLSLDAVMWLVTPGNPLKDPSIYAPYEERLRQARRAADHPDIVVSDFERRHGLTYTVDTIDRLKALNPNTNYVWLMGADSFETLHEWRDWRNIVQSAPIAVFRRPGYENAPINSVAAREFSFERRDIDAATGLADLPPPAWIFFPETDNKISSTAIRARIDREQVEPIGDLEAPYGDLAFFLDLHPAAADFRTDAHTALSARPRSISPMYFYDAEGSRLFDKITSLKEYYVTHTERSLFLNAAADITSKIFDGATVVEYGSGSSEKVEWLVNGVHNAAGYVAIDISKEHLVRSATELAGILPVPVGAICADFHSVIKLPDGVLPAANGRLGYFPGSTVGNMAPESAAAFLRRAHNTLGDNAQFLIGFDLAKDRSIIEEAYNDAEGVTAAFNLNLLTRLKNELGAEIDVGAFEHVAFFNEAHSRLEMHLRAKEATSIVLDGRSYDFKLGETIHTENSYKYSIDRFSALLEETPWRLTESWFDDRRWFAACLLRNS